METVTLFRTNDNTMCPVQQAAALVQRLQHDKRITKDTTVDTFISTSGQVSRVMSANVRRALHEAYLAVGEEKLGFKPNKIGPHSLCSGAAMAMHLAEIPVYTIMIIGRWSSDAFLCYIRKQAAHFSQNIAKGMLHTHSFIQVPNNKQISSLDPNT